MLQVSLDYPFVIAPSVFYNVYLFSVVFLARRTKKFVNDDMRFRTFQVKQGTKKQKFSIVPNQCLSFLFKFIPLCHL